MRRNEIERRKWTGRNRKLKKCGKKENRWTKNFYKHKMIIYYPVEIFFFPVFSFHSFHSSISFIHSIHLFIFLPWGYFFHLLICGCYGEQWKFHNDFIFRMLMAQAIVNVTNWELFCCREEKNSHTLKCKNAKNNNCSLWKFDIIIELRIKKNIDFLYSRIDRTFDRRTNEDCG